MNYLSVCSGIEAATVAWHPLGWKPLAFAEIDRFPSAVLNHHYPDVPNLGNLSRFHDWPDMSPGLLVGGTPCQPFSVAGLRGGLADPRGNLALTYLAVADRYRPRWLLWENVPGVLSSNRGRDFGAFLGALGQLGYGWAYRVLDAQYFGVPQRRRRVFVVGYLGDWQRAAEVLFERHCLSGDSPPRRETGEDVARLLRGRANASHREDSDNYTIFRTLNAGGMGRQDWETETFVAHSLRGDGFDASEDGTGRGTPLVADCLTKQYASHHGRTAGNNGGVANGHLLASTLAGRQNSIKHENTAVIVTQGVRRLTPEECEALQGFSRGYTAIPGAKDGPRYKALGNSMAVPVMRWIGERIATLT